MIAFLLSWMVASGLDAYLPCRAGLTVEYRGSDGSAVTDTVLGFTHPREPRLCLISRARPSARSEVWAREHLADRVSYAGDVETLLALRPPILRQPLAAGIRWHWNRTDYAITAVGRPIEVPAGRFSDTIWIEESSAGGEHHAVSVYAAGVGLVRHVRGSQQMEAVRVAPP